MMKRIFLFMALLFCSKLSHPSELSDAYGKVLKIIHGGTVKELRATPILCGEARPKTNNTQSKDQVWEKQLNWLSGNGACKHDYEPNIYSLFSPSSHGGEISQFFFDQKVYETLIIEIEKIGNSENISKLPISQKLDIQLTFWELMRTLNFRRTAKIPWQPDIDQHKIDRLLKVSSLVLNKVLFSNQDIDALNKIGSQDKTFAVTHEKILKGCYLEANEPSRIHQLMSGTRLYARIIIGLDQENISMCDKLKNIAKTGDRSVLINLPWTINDYDAYLFLYYNVLDDSLKVVPTNLIHGVRRIHFKGAASPPEPVLVGYDLFTFEVIDRQKNLKDASLVYQATEDNQVVRKNILDVSPVYALDTDNSIISTAKAVCFNCHGRRTKTFDLRKLSGEPRLTLSKPFENSSEFYRLKSLDSYESATKFFLKNRMP